MPYADPVARLEYQKRYRNENAARIAEQKRARRDEPERERDRARWPIRKDAANARAREKRAADPERARSSERAYRERNREQRRIASNERYHANPAYFARYSRRRILRRYGLTPESYLALKVAQDGACAICLAPFPDSPEPHIDHNHATGQVRGLLCALCNQAIGLFRDDPVRLARAVAYIGGSK